IGDIQGQGNEVFSQFLLKLRQLVSAACATNDAITVSNQFAADGFAESGGCAGYKCGFHGVLPLKKIRPGTSRQGWRTDRASTAPALGAPPRYPCGSPGRCPRDYPGCCTAPVAVPADRRLCRP